MQRRNRPVDNDDDDDRRNDDDFYGGQQKKKDHDSHVAGRSLWDAAKEIVASHQQHDVVTNESNTVLFVGSRHAGKTTMILRYLDRTNEAPKPSIALDYNYAKKSKNIENTNKEVGHIWELADGTLLPKLIDVALTPETIGNAAVVFVLDLSEPQELWQTYQILYEAVSKRVKFCIGEATKQNPNLKEKLKESILRRIGNADKTEIEPLRIPMLIIGSKYDLFQAKEPEEKKSIIKTLRFLAHYHGASLMSYSEKQEGVVLLKSMINHFLFDTDLPNKQTQVDYQRALFVKAGSETMEQIGPPPIPEYDLGDLREKTPIAVWRAAFCKRFPQENEKRDPSLTQDYGRDPQYADSSIDAMREQKLAELQRYLTMKTRSRS